MPPPPGKPEDSPYFCKCEVCARRGGRVISRSTWYLHNPGGKGAKAPNLSLEEFDYMINLPTPKLTKISQRRLEKARADLRERISKRSAGSASVSVIRLQCMRRYLINIFPACSRSEGAFRGT